MTKNIDLIKEAIARQFAAGKCTEVGGCLNPPSPEDFRYRLWKHIPDFVECRREVEAQLFKDKTEFESLDTIRYWSEEAGNPRFSVDTDSRGSSTLMVDWDLMSKKTGKLERIWYVVGFLGGRPPWLPDWVHPSREELDAWQGD